MKLTNAALILMTLTTIFTTVSHADTSRLACQSADGKVAFEASRTVGQTVYRFVVGERELKQADIDGLPRMKASALPVGVPNLIPVSQRLSRDFAPVEIRRQGSVTFATDDGFSGQIRYVGSSAGPVPVSNGGVKRAAMMHMMKFLVTEDMLSEMSSDVKAERTRDGVIEINLNCVETRESL